MIYFDNAATTMQKPSQVAEAVCQALNSFGGVGRGIHEASLSAGMAVYDAREELAKLFGASSATNIAFSHNATEALNIALTGLIKPHSHVITTAAAHNSILRPLYRLCETANIELSIIPILPDGSLDWDAYRAAFKHNTSVVAAPHASNLTGDVYDIVRMARIAHEHGAVIVVDAAQSAGVIPINMQDETLDVVCFTGHKSLYGPQGTGGIAVAPHINIKPYNVGGSGSHSFDHAHPTTMPESLEAGTLNAHGIAGLCAGVRFVKEKGINEITAHEQMLAQRLTEGLQSLEARVLGGGTDTKTAVVAFTYKDVDSGEISDALQYEYGICTRAGAHCAPLMHEAMGTVSQGATRMSFSYFNTLEEVDEALEALAAIFKEYSS